jgi:hypothetical protein
VPRRNLRREAAANPRQPAYLDPWAWPATDPIPAPVIVGPRAGEERPGLRPRVNWVPFHNRSGPRFPREAGLGAPRYWPRDHGRDSLSTVLVSRFAALFPGSHGGSAARGLGSRHTGPASDPAPVIVGPTAGEERPGLRPRANWAPFHNRGGTRRVTVLAPGSRPGLPLDGPCFQVRGLVSRFAWGSCGPSDSGPGTRVPRRILPRESSDPAPVIVGPRAGEERLGLRPRANWAPFHDRGGTPRVTLQPPGSR